MKVYVVKNDKNEYMTETGDFINSLWQAELFYDYECAYCYATSGCNIVECSLMEKYQLADYTKQVRKEVLADLKEKYKQKMANALGDDEEIGHMNCDTVLEELLEEIGFDEVLELYRSQGKWYA